MVIIEKPYKNRGWLGDGILYGYGHAKRKHKDISKIVFLCCGEDYYNIRPEDYRFYKVIDDKPIEVPQTRNFYTGKRYIDPKYYVKKGIK